MIDVSGVLTLDHTMLMIEATADRVGIAYVPEIAARPWLNDGRLAASSGRLVTRYRWLASLLLRSPSCAGGPLRFHRSTEGDWLIKRGQKGNRHDDETNQGCVTRTRIIELDDSGIRSNQKKYAVRYECRLTKHTTNSNES